MARQLPLPNSALAPSALHSALSIAVVIAAGGWLLVQHADWPKFQVGTALIGYAILAACVAIAATSHLKGAVFGLANQITLLRAGLVCLVGSEILAGAAPVQTSWSLAALIALALSVDAVDGWLARRLGSASSFGARFDLEIDALMLMILSVLVWQADRAGLWVLAIGLLRYGFVALGLVWAGIRRPLPYSFRRKTICAVLGVLLLVCMLPPTPWWLALSAAATAFLLQLLSFGIDLFWLVRRDIATGSRGHA
ncbi:MAG: CDP-alcohol phosphatidyltransferase family protein [Pseudomonadota bacterium]